MPHPRQVIGGRKAGRSGAYHGDRLITPCIGQRKRPGRSNLSGGPFQGPHLDRTIHLDPVAGDLAGVIADSAANAGQRGLLEKDGQCPVIIALGSPINGPGDIVSDRAGGPTGCGLFHEQRSHLGPGAGLKCFGTLSGDGNYSFRVEAFQPSAFFAIHRSSI